MRDPGQTREYGRGEGGATPRDGANRAGGSAHRKPRGTDATAALEARAAGIVARAAAASEIQNTQFAAAAAVEARGADAASGADAAVAARDAGRRRKVLQS